MQSIKDGVLDGKVAFITGGTSGINIGIARRFVKAGASVAVLGRNRDKASAAAAALGALGGKAIAVTADVREPEALEAAFQEASNALGAIDILVCGAGGTSSRPRSPCRPRASRPSSTSTCSALSTPAASATSICAGRAPAC